MASIADVRWHAFSFLDNLVLDDQEEAVAELKAFRAAGGDLVVDLTSSGLNPDPKAVTRIAQAAGVRVVLGAGWYVHASHEPWVCRADVEELAAWFDRQATDGIAETGIRPGVFGEIGMSAPPESCERRVLRASARVAARYDMSVHIHVDNAGAFGPQHVKDCVAEGLPADRVVCGHMDERLDPDYHGEILDLGANLAFDTFGSDLRFSGLFTHPSDGERMRHVSAVLRAGHGDRILLGHDVFVKAHLHAFGGNGYDHLLARVGPALRTDFGLTDDEIDQLMVKNPRRLLACTPPGSTRQVEEGRDREYV